MSTAPSVPAEEELSHLQGNVNRLRALFSSLEDSSEQTVPVARQLRCGSDGCKDHSPSPFQAARVSLQNIEEDLHSIHGLLSTPSSSRDGAGRLWRSVSPATPKVDSITEPCVSNHEPSSATVAVTERTTGSERSVTSSSQQACGRLSDIEQWDHGSKEPSNHGPGAGSPKQMSPPPPPEQTPPSGHSQRRRFLSLSEEELTAEKYATSADSSYSIRVDFGMSIHNSLHRPKDDNCNSLTHAIDTLLMVTGNEGMSARNVEEHVKEQTRMMQGQDQSKDCIIAAPDVQSAAAEVVQPLPPPHLDSSGRTVSSTRPDLVLSIASTLSSSEGSSGSSVSTVRASPQPGLKDGDGPKAAQASGYFPYRPPSVRSLPTGYPVPARATCHCPYCCSCGSYQKQLDSFPSHHFGQHQRSPSIQSVPVYLEGTSLDVSLARRSRNCPLQRFFYHSARPSPLRSGAAQRSLSEQHSSHSSVEDLPQMRSSVKEMAQSFERLATGVQGMAGSELSLCSMSTTNGAAESTYAHPRHPSEHRRSPSLVSVSIPEESLSGLACHTPLSSAALPTPTSMGDGNLLQMADSSRDSLTSLSSQRTSMSTDRLNYCGQNLHVGVDGKVFRDRMEMLRSWYRDFSDQQRNGLLSKLLDWSNCSQMRHLSLQMEPILHQRCPHNCQDLLSWLPPSICYQILIFLDPVSLCRCLLVSRQWYFLASNSQLWRYLCSLERYQLSPQGQKKQLEEHTLADGSVQWKEIFEERYRLWRNWSYGYCNIRTFEGHTQGVSCVQFDDNRIVSGSSDKTIKVWNIRTNTAWAALTLEGHSGDVRCLHLHGNRLISGSSDRTIKVWELFMENASWLGATCRVTLVGHTHTVRCLQSDEHRIISGSYDHTLKIWDIDTGTCRHTLRGHTDHVLCVQFKDNMLVSGSGDCTIIVWDLSTYEMKRTLRGHKAAVTTLQFDSSRIISGSLDRLIKIWDLGTWQCIHTLDWIHSEGHTGVIRHLQANHWKMVSAADDKTLKVWSLDRGERLLTLRSHTDGVTCVQFNDKVIVSGSYDKTVKLWDFSAC